MRRAGRLRSRQESGFPRGVRGAMTKTLHAFPGRFLAGQSPEGDPRNALVAAHIGALEGRKGETKKKDQAERLILIQVELRGIEPLTS